MGSALGDFDGDGDPDWFVTAIFDTASLAANPGNRLYRNDGSRAFTDVSDAAGVRDTGPGFSWGWGTTPLDYDNDGDLDLAATNGFVALGYGGDRTTLWRNDGGLIFSDVSADAGITDTGQGRGLLHLDYDADGDLDLLVVNYGAAPILYRNDSGNEAHWLRVRAQGPISNRDGIGAVIRVVPDRDHPETFQVREIGTGGSYLSQSEATAHFGLGDLGGAVGLVEIDWPTSGIRQTLLDVPIDTEILVLETPVPEPSSHAMGCIALAAVLWVRVRGKDRDGPSGVRRST
jgi:hypothetical protein